jgi:hypothetical protein
MAVTRTPTATPTETRAIGVILMHDTAGNPLICGIDPLSDVSIIGASNVSPDWTTYNTMVPLAGLGTTTNGQLTDKCVECPLHLQYGRRHDLLDFHVHSLPGGLDCIMGVDLLDRMGCIVDRNSFRVHFKAIGMTVPLHTIYEMKARQSMPPLKILAACSGGSFAYTALVNMGFQIERWTSIETDATCRAVAESLIPQHQLDVVEPHDITAIPHDHPVRTQVYDLYMDTSPCQPWSRLRVNPPGFADARAKPMLASMQLYQQLKAINPDMKLIAENVVPATCEYIY